MEAARLQPEFTAIFKGIRRLQEADSGISARWPKWHAKEKEKDTNEGMSEHPARRVLRPHLTDESTAAPTETTVEEAIGAPRAKRRIGRRARSRAKTEEYFRCIGNVENDRQITIPVAALCAILEERLDIDEIAGWDVEGMNPSGPASPARASSSGADSSLESGSEPNLESDTEDWPSQTGACRELEEEAASKDDLHDAGGGGEERGAAKAGRDSRADERSESDPHSAQEDLQSSESSKSGRANQGNCRATKRSKKAKDFAAGSQRRAAASQSWKEGSRAEQFLEKEELEYTMKEPRNSVIGEQVWQYIPRDSIGTLQRYNYYEPFCNMTTDKSARFLEMVLEATAARLQEPNRTPAIGDSDRAWSTETGCELARTLCKRLAGVRAFSSTVAELEKKLPELQRVASGAKESFDMPASLLAYGDVLLKFKVCIQRARAWQESQADSEDPEIPSILNGKPKASTEAAAIAKLTSGDLQSLLQARVQASRRS